MWKDKVLNPQLIKILFKDENLSLSRIKMRNVQLIIGIDLVCVMIFDLENYLTSPPAKWVEKGYNTVQMRLSFIQSSIRIAKMSGSNAVGTLNIEYTGKEFEVSHANEENDDRVMLHCGWIHVDKIEGYQEGV